MISAISLPFDPTGISAETSAAVPLVPKAIHRPFAVHSLCQSSNETCLLIVCSVGDGLIVWMALMSTHGSLSVARRDKCPSSAQDQPDRESDQREQADQEQHCHDLDGALKRAPGQRGFMSGGSRIVGAGE